MIQNIFTDLPTHFVTGTISEPVTFYFSLGDIKKTVAITADNCTVSDGKTVEDADCVCKTSPEFFVKIWEENYRPGMKDFLSGTIKSNDPTKLQLFLSCFGKQ